jgi:hypothetical protein
MVNESGSYGGAEIELFNCNLANVPYLLSAFEKNIGIDSHAWTLMYDSYIKYPEDIITPLPRDNLCIARTWHDRDLKDADVYHIHDTYGLPNIVNRYITNTDTPVILHYHGTYLRLNGGNKTLNKQAKYIFVSTPDLLQYIPEKYIHKAYYIPNPVSIDPYYTCMNNYVGKVKIKTDDFSISHTSTNVGIKGTNAVAGVLKYMKDNYGVPYYICMKSIHWDSLQTMKISDVYLDQFNIGTYGVAAIEALLMGKVVLCWIDNAWGQYYPECPIKSCMLNGLIDGIKAVMGEWEMYKSNAKQRIAWASTFHSPLQIARYFEKIYEGMEPIRDPAFYLRWKN